MFYHTKIIITTRSIDLVYVLHYWLCFQNKMCWDTFVWKHTVCYTPYVTYLMEYNPRHSIFLNFVGAITFTSNRSLCWVVFKMGVPTARIVRACFRLQPCWWRVNVGDIILVTILGCWWRKNNVDDIFRDIGDNLVIGHQHHKRSRYDIGNRFQMLEELNEPWWRFSVCRCQ